MENWSSLVRLATTGPGWLAAQSQTTAWAAAPGDLTGKDNELVDTLSSVPTGRLIVLGEPGAGKTILLVRLVLDLLARRSPDGPVPVLVPLASWNPLSEDLYSWLERRLAIDYPGLGEPGPSDTGVSRGRELLEAGLVLLVLDGLDEIPDAVRGPAITRINDALRPGQHLVLASRSESFKMAVRPPTGVEVRLAGAGGIELCPLEAAVVADYLRDSAGGSAAAARWDRVLSVIASNGTKPIAQALTTPLMASLARVIYNPRPGESADALSRKPDELLNKRLFPSRIKIEEHLFDAFIRAAYRPYQDSVHDCRWTVDQAERWLIFLACDLQYRQSGTTDLSWWRVQDKAPRLLVGLCVGLIAGVAGAYGLLIGAGLGAALMSAVTVGLVVRRWSQRSTGLALGLAGGLIGGLSGAGVALGIQSAFGVELVPGSALAGGLASGIAVGALKVVP
jgi:hypothetical protein